MMRGLEARIAKLEEAAGVGEPVRFFLVHQLGDATNESINEVTIWGNTVGRRKGEKVDDLVDRAIQDYGHLRPPDCMYQIVHAVAH